MKELQNFVYRHMDALKHHKRYLAMLTALSMLVTFIVPLILVEPADSMTGILVCNKTVHTHNAECYVGDTLVCDIEEHIHTGACYKKISTVSLKGDASESEYTDYNIPVYNAGGGLQSNGTYTPANDHPVDAAGSEYYNPAKLPLYTLLFGTGENHWVKPNLSLEQNLEIVDDEYFLGFASDFCAFIESDFTAFDADAEGRMFVGGDLIFNGIPNGKKWNYQVGAGDYGQFTPILQTDEYGHLKGFASAIIGGKVYRLATMTTGAYSSLSHDTSGITDRHTDGNDVMLYPEEGAYKRFIIGNLKDSLHYDEDVEVDIPYDVKCNHLYYQHSCSLCKGLTTEEMANNKHSYLGKVNELSQFYIYDHVSTILERTFDTLRARSLSLASVQAIEGKIENNTLKLDASDIGDAKTVYFKINNWEGIQRVVITVPDDRITYTESGDKEEKYSNGKKTIKNLDLNVIITCGEEEIEITQSIPTYILAKTADKKPDDGYGYKISNRGKDDGANATNNHPVSSNILYNFYNAEKVTFTGDTNFNGTIFAPNAKVTAPETCRGHLSGALIAKSFYGGLEFGYRPYRGGVDIFGMASGYAIPVNKFGDDGETALPGALFAIKQDGKFVSLFESGEGTNFAALPSKVDFSGKTAYEQDEITQDTTASRNYAGNTVIGEKLTAPVDFTLYYYDSNGEKQTITDDSKLENLTVFYLKANQRVNLESNENFVYTYDNNTDIYTIYPIKLVDSFTITAKNAADNTSEKTATVNFNTKTAAMELTVDKDVVTLNDEVSDEISLGVTNPPTGNTIYYKFLANGNVIKVNDNTQDNGYTTDNSGTYTPNVAGGLELSVKAYVKVGEEYYEVESAIAPKVTVKQADLAIKLYKVENGNDKIDLTNNTLISGETLNIVVEGVPNGATIQYEFYNKHANTNNKSQTFDTNGIVGKNLTVKAIINGTTTLEDTVTVEFPDMTLNLLSTNYVVGHSGISFKLNNIPQGAALRCVVDGNSTEYTKGYCNSYEEWYISPKVVRTDIPVDVYVEMNGLTKKFTKYINGTYHENLGMSISQGPYTVGSDITLSLDYAPNGAKVEFKAYDSNNNEVLSTTSDVNNGVATAKFTPNKADKYTFKAFMTYESNPKLEFKIENIDVVAKPVYGELSVNPNVVNTGNKVYFKLYNATSDANVSFKIRKKNESDNNDSYIDIATINGTQGNSGEYTAEYTPSQAGTYNVNAIISKDGATNSYESEFTVNENTSTLDGDLTLDPSDETVKPNTQITVNVSNATNGAVLKLTVKAPDGTEKTDTVTISNGSYYYSFNAEKVGTYTVTGTLTSGTQTHSLGERKVTVMDEITIETIGGADENGQFKIGEPVTLGLSNLPDKAVRVDYYLLSLDANNVIQNKDELKPSSYNNDDTITFTPGQTGEHEYRANAIDGSGNVIATVTQKFTTIMPKYEIDIKADKEVYTGGEKVTITIDGLPTGNSKFVINNIQCYLDGYGGMTLTKDENTGEYSFTAPNFNLSNDPHNLQITFNYNNGVSLTDTIQIIICEDPEKVVNVTSNGNPKIVSLAFKKYLNILEDENTGTDLTDNCIIIDSQDGTFKSVSLVLPSDYNSETASFTLKATFKAANGDTIGDGKTYSNSAVVNGKIDITDIPADTATIEITPVAGSVTIANCNPIFTKTETKIEQKYAQGFTLNKDEQKEIVLTNWAKDGSTQILDSITFNLNKNGKIYYALIREGETTAPVFKEAKLENNTAKIEGINAEGIEKIKIYTTDESLTINDYTISAFVGSSKYSESELKAFRKQTQDIINVYTLVEQQAPAGYFKNETVYIVEVKETIKFYETAGESPYPRDVLTTVTVKETNGDVVLSYAVDVDYSSSNGTEEKIITIVDNDENPNNNVKFTLTKGEDGTLTVGRTNSNVNVSEWSTATKPVSNDGYYFDPEAMMVVPVPTPIKYENTIGLHFRKIDNKGASVNGVKIELYEGDSKVTDTNLWYWDENSSDWLIDYTQLSPESVYRLTETDAGGMFEPSEDIYFKKTGDNTDKEIMYWIGSATMPEESKVEVLDLTEDYESRVIRMENIRIPGLKPTVVKTDLNGGVINGEGNDAVFSLHANNGTELLDNVTITDGRIKLDLSNPGANKTAYIENGYLKPGTYYLKEIKAPSGYEPSMKFFYFNVEQNEKGAFSITPVEKRPGISVLTEKIDNENCEVIRFTKNALDEISDDKIKNNNIILQFTLNTSVSDEVTQGYKNYRFMGNHNEQYYKQAKKVVSNANITYKLTAGDMLKLLGITLDVDNPDTTDKNEFVEQFRQLSVFEIVTVNSTKVVDWQFLEIEDKAENISKIIIEDSSNVKINDFKITYNNGSSFNKGNNDIKIENNELQLPKGCSLNNVAKIELTASEFDGEKKVIIETTDGRRIWGDKTNTHNDYPNYSDSYKMIKKDVACVFGFDPDTTSNNPETSTTYNFPTLTVRSDDRNTVYISNDVLKPTMKLRAEKKWVGDTGITELRKPVEVQLMQKQLGGENEFDYKAFNPTIDKDEQSTEDDEQSTEDGEQSTENGEQSTEGGEQSTEGDEQSTEGGEQPTEGNEQSTSGRVTLNEANNWSYIWEDLPRFVNGENADAGLYYYTVKEITTVPGYETVNPNENINEGGTIVITNTAKTVDVPVEKTWTWDETKYNNPSIPRTVVFKLQVKVNNAPEQWMDVPGKTLKLTGNGTAWNGKFTGLIEGYEYKIVEVDVPFGWTPTIGDNVDISTENGNRNFTVNNTYEIREGSIALQKLWQDLTGNEDAVLPTEIYLDLYRSVVAPSYTDTDAPYTDKDVPGSTVNDKPKYMTDYARLLQHSLYFYDANMCGTDVAEKSALAWRTNCHTEDEVPGGYHDAGDHVMFGLPQGYTASMLGWSYLEFIKENESGYKVNDAEKAHYKVILERFYDFFVNSVEYNNDGSISKILAQKGDGNIDHLVWCAPEIQTSRSNEMFWTENGANIAAEYAAALALGYINFNDNSSKYQNYLEVAKKLYDYATTPGRGNFCTKDNDTGNNFYDDTESDDDIAWAAAWLYEATGKQSNSQYKGVRSDATGELQWDSVKLAAACAKARQDGEWGNVTKFIDDTYINGSKKDFYYIHAWGTARFNTMAQTVALVAAKHIKAADAAKSKGYVDWAVKQMNQILGDNKWKDTINDACNGGTVTDTAIPICLVTNFVPEGVDIDTPQAPHHRAASGLDSVNGDSNLEYKENCAYDDDSYALIGALVGGPSLGENIENTGHTGQPQMNTNLHNHPTSGHTYIDCLHDYCCNEVAIDYNSGLVGAAAGLYYFLGSGERSTMIEGVEYGSYGLKNANELDDTYYDSANGLKSPTISAPPQTTQNYGISPIADVTNDVLKTFAFKQTSVRVMADESKYTLLGTYSVASSEYSHNKDCEYTLSSITEGKTVDLIEMVFDGNGSITGQIVPNGSWNDRMEPNNVALVDNVLSISTFPKSISKIKINNWGTNVNLIAIRLYTERTGPSISSSHSTIAQGDMLTLTYSESGVTPNWSVANKDTSITNELASMTGNVLTANGVGVVVVKALDASGNELATKEITIEEFAISGNDQMTKNGEQTLKTNSISSVEWSLSSDSPNDVIEVDNGKVTAIGIGTATVVAKNKTNNIYSDSFEITVTKQMPQLTFNGNATINVGGETYVNRNMDLTVQYKDANGNVSGLTIENNNKVIADTPGYYTLWIEDDDHDKSELSLTVKPKISIDGNNSTNGNNTTIDVGDHVTFTLNPDAEIQYSPNNEDGLTVDNNNNKVTAAKAGTYKIWTHVNGVNSDEIQITVNPVATSLKITPDDYYLQTDVAKNINISGNTGNITWTFNSVNSTGATVAANSTAIEVIDQQLVAHKPGTYIVTGTDEAGGTVSFKVEVGDYIAKVDINNYATNGWGDKISVPALPDEYSTYEIDRVGFKLSGKAADGKYKFGIDNLSSETQDYEFNNLSENFCHTINIKPTENVQYGTWSQKGIVPTAMYLIYNRPALAITYGDTKPDEITITEGETITLGYINNNGTVTWQGGVNSDGSYTAPIYVEGETNEYTITASDGTNEDTITINVNPLTITPIDKITELRSITLELNTTRDLSEFDWSSSDSSKISVDNGKLTVKNNGKATITATDKNNTAITANIEVEADVTTEDLTISGNNSTGIGGEIQLTYSGGPLGVERYEWTSSDESIATVDQNGKVVGIAPGNVEITLTAYDKDKNVLDSKEKNIEIKNIYTKQVNVNETISRTEKYFVSLEDIPSNAKIQSITVNLNGNMKSNQIVHRTYISEDEKVNDSELVNDSGKTNCDIRGSGSIVWDTSKISDKMPVGQENSKYAFEIWWSDDSTLSATIESIVIEYEWDGREIKLTSDKKVARIGEEIELTIDTLNCDATTITAEPSGIIKLPTSCADGKYTIETVGVGRVTICVKVDDKLSKTLSLTVKDNFSISQDNVVVSGATFADINSTSTFKVNNLMGDGPNWQIDVDKEVYETVTNGTVVTIKEKDINGTTGKTIATFDKNTGKLTTSGVDGDFTITATDSYGNGSTASVMVTVTDRPKLPELPKEIFLGNKIDTIILTKEDKLGNEKWAKEVKKLPMTDEKGNPYYYYIQESGYSVNGTYHPMESTDNFIYSSNASFMPYNYYDNGIVPVENPNDQNPVKVAKVGNKFLSKQEGQLPSTGGSGVTTYYYLGGVIMLLSIAGFTGLKRRERKRRKE